MEYFVNLKSLIERSYPAVGLKMYGGLTILLTIWILIVAPAYAGWSEDLRLTHRHFEMYSQVAARGDTVHVAWQQIAGPEHISYIRSTDGGYNWSEIRNLEDSVYHHGARQDLWLTPDYIFVGWLDWSPESLTVNIGYTYSADGTTWQSPRYIFPDGTELYDLGTAAYRDSVYAVYSSEEQDSTGAHLLKFLYSSDMGITWSDEDTIGRLDEYTNFLHMAHCGNSLYIVWASDMPPLGYIREVMAVVSHNGGQSWSDVIQLSSPDTAVAQLTCVACDEESGNFAVGWMDAGRWHHYPGDLYVRITTDGGYTWMPESHATYDRWVFRSSINIKGDSLWAVWEDRDPAYGQGNYEICFSYSSDLGISWSPNERLTFNPERSVAPGIANDGGKLHVVWYNDNPLPEDGRDIYYKRFEPEVGIGNESGENLPDRITLSAYPNPFNSACKITVSDPAVERIDIYDITGRRVELLPVSDGQVVWEPVNHSSGIYFARANGGNSNATIKLLYLK